MFYMDDWFPEGFDRSPKNMIERVFRDVEDPTEAQRPNCRPMERF